MTLAEIVAEVTEILGPVVSSICLSDCNHNGICVNATCECDDGWFEVDLHVSVS